MRQGIEPLELGQRLMAVLETGRRTATYKLATLMALMEYCIEHLPADPQDEVVVPVAELGERVLELYWNQVRPFEGDRELRQSTQSKARILHETAKLRLAAGVGFRQVPLETARLVDPTAYDEAVAAVALVLAQQPLPRLQRTAEGGVPFLYDDTWMHDDLSRRQLEARGGAITLFGGAGHALAQLSALLRPALMTLWVDDVRALNKDLTAEGPDIAGHLFGRDRTGLAPVRSALADAFGARCFYCSTGVGKSAPVDHVLPWSRVPLDGLANLVLSCQRCNGDKRASLPSVDIVARSLGRDASVLDEMATTLRWPTQRPRVVASARGLYLGQAIQTPLWSGRGSTAVLDVASRHWLEVTLS